MEATQYVEINEHGSAVVSGTRIHVEAIGFVHESGDYTEQEIRDWFKINRIQLYGALAYFYQNRDEIVSKLKQAEIDAQGLSQQATDKLRAWKSQNN